MPILERGLSILVDAFQHTAFAVTHSLPRQRRHVEFAAGCDRASPRNGISNGALLLSVMPRMMDSREVHRRLRGKFPDAYIGIQQGDFVSFLSEASGEICSLLGEMPMDMGSYKCISVHKLRFENFANRLLLASGKPVVWAEKFITPSGKGSSRVVKVFGGHSE